MDLIYAERQPTVSPSGFRYGRHIQHDPRSWKYQVLPRRGALKSVRWDRHIPFFDQNAAGLGDCVANTAIGLLGTGPMYDAYRTLPVLPYPLTEAGVIAAYIDITATDPFPGYYLPGDPASQDTGTDGLSAAQDFKAKGAISGYQSAMGLDAALAALQIGPVGFGFGWYDSMEDPSRSNELVIARGAQVVGGHEVVGSEIDVERKRVWIDNSWSPAWGDGGRAWMSWTTLGRLLKENGDVIQFVAPTAAAPKPIPAPAPPAGVTAAQLWAELAATARRLGL